MFFGQYNGHEKVELIVESGGVSHEIPLEFQCPSRRHDKRLTSCYCQSLSDD